MNNEMMGFDQPNGVMCVYFVHYVHGVGCSIRSVPLPMVPDTQFTRWMTEAGEEASDAPNLFMFTGYWPNRPDTLYEFVTWRSQEIIAILKDARQIRLFGEEMKSKLLPIDPITGGTGISIADHNNWIRHHMMGEERIDFDVSLDFNEIEEFLNNSKGETQ